MSTKCTLFYGKDFHIYTDYAVDMGTTVLMEIKNKQIELPKELSNTLKKLARLHEACKCVMDYTRELDKNDGGLFIIKLKKRKVRK